MQISTSRILPYRPLQSTTFTPKFDPEPPGKPTLARKVAVRTMGGLAGMTFMGGPAMFASSRTPGGLALAAFSSAVMLTGGLQGVPKGGSIKQVALEGIALSTASAAAGYVLGPNAALALCAGGAALGLCVNWNRA